MAAMAGKPKVRPRVASALGWEPPSLQRILCMHFQEKERVSEQVASIGLFAYIPDGRLAVLFGNFHQSVQVGLS